jgi:hypothetical protein
MFEGLKTCADARFVAATKEKATKLVMYTVRVMRTSRPSKRSSNTQAATAPRTANLTSVL